MTHRLPGQVVVFVVLLVGCEQGTKSTVPVTATPQNSIDEVEAALQRIESHYGQIWYTLPPDLGSSDESPRAPTAGERASAATSVLGISFAPPDEDAMSDLGTFGGLQAVMILGQATCSATISSPL